LIILPAWVETLDDNYFAHFSTGRDAVIPVDENHQSDSSRDALARASVVSADQAFELAQPSQPVIGVNRC
jgi:hypothetical protein